MKEIFIQQFYPKNIPSPEQRFAYWHSGGGTQHRCVIPAENPIPDGWREGRQVTKDNFEEIFKTYASFEMREFDSVVEIAIVPHQKGWWIGKGGEKIRRIKKIFQKDVRLTDAIFLELVQKSDTDFFWTKDGEIIGKKGDYHDEDIISPRRDAGLGFMVVSGWIASWKLKKENEKEG